MKLRTKVDEYDEIRKSHFFIAPSITVIRRYIKG